MDAGDIRFGEKKNSYQKELAAILLRLVYEDWEKVDNTFLAKYGETLEGRLVNMHVYSRLFVNLDIRSCVAVHVVEDDLKEDEKEKRKSLTKNYLPALLDTIQLIRMRWSAYVILNAYMDKKIKKLRETSAKIDAQEKISEADIYSILHGIAFIRKELSTSLETPITFKRAAASLNNIYEHGVRLFGIDALETMVIEKMKMLDRSYEDIREKRGLEELKRLSEKQGGKGEEIEEFRNKMQEKLQGDSDE